VTLKNFSLLLVISMVLFTVGLSQMPSADAISAGSEFTPTQPNANVSFNNVTKQIQVDWNFTTGISAPETCLLKGDFVWYGDLNDKHSSGVSGVDYDKVTGFIPLFYSTVSSSPVTVVNGAAAEVVPCTGSTKIDIDTIMNHSENINNYSDLEIFLTFYVPNADGSLNLADASRIDEVFVMYAPTSIFDEDAYRDYGCGDDFGTDNDGIGNQIGSTLYIDASGSNDSVIAYGDNGDNCGDHLYLENDEYVDIGPQGSGSEGIADYGSHASESFQLLWRHATGGGDDCSADCRPPTLESFMFNNSTNWLAQNNQTFTIGDKQVLTFSYSDNRGIDEIDQVEIGFGLPSMYSPMFEAEIIIEINTENEIFESLIIYDENNLFLENSTTVTVNKINCVSNDCSELKYTLEFVWAEKPFDGYFLIVATDNRGNASYDRLVEELYVLGETLNEQPTLEIYNRSTSTMKDGLFVTIQRIDKYSDMWIDDEDRYWQGYGNHRFEIIPLTVAALLYNH